MAGIPERKNERVAPSSRLLHNFNLPSNLKWGRQKYLRCVKSTRPSTDLYVTPLSLNPVQQNNSPFPLYCRFPITTRPICPSKINKGKSVVTSSSDRGTSEIEAVPQELMRDLKVTVDEHMKLGFLEEIAEDVIPVDDPIPWNFHNCQTFGRAMNDGARLRWGHQKQAHQVKSTQSTATASYVTPISLSPIQQNNSPVLSCQFPISAHPVNPPKINKGKSAITFSDGGTSEVEDARQTLLRVLKINVEEHLNRGFVEEKGKAEEMKPVDPLPSNVLNRQAFGKTTKESARLRRGHRKCLQRIKSTQSNTARYVTPISETLMQQQNSPVPSSCRFPITSSPVTPPKINKGESAFTFPSYGGTSEIEAAYQKLVSNLKVAVDKHLKLDLFEEKVKAKEDLKLTQLPWNSHNCQSFGKTKNESGKDLWPVPKNDRGYRSLFSSDRGEASGGREQQRFKFSVAQSRDQVRFLGDGRGKAASES